jgi:GntR family transcriptional regulator
MNEQEQSRYRQVVEILAARISDGYYAAAGRLPSQQELGHEFKVGNTTLRMALAILEDRGLIVSEQGKRGFQIVKPEGSSDRGPSDG